MDTIIQYIFSPVIAALSGYMVYLLQQNRKSNSASGKGIQLLLRRQIINAHKKFVVDKEAMTAFDFEDLEEIHGAYKALDGNGLTDKMWEEIESRNLEKH